MWPFKKKPMSIEVVDAVFALLTEEEIQHLYDEEARLIEKDMKEIVIKITPNWKARYSMEKSLRIAKEELTWILKLPTLRARRRVLDLFGDKLFKY